MTPATGTDTRAAAVIPRPPPAVVPTNHVPPKPHDHPPVSRPSSSLGLRLALGARSAELVTLAGKKSAGTLVSVDPQAVGFQEDGAGTVAKVSVKEVAVVDLKNTVVAPAKGAKHDEVELTDGSVLRLAGFKVKGKAVEPGWLPGPDGVAPPKVGPAARQRLLADARRRGRRRPGPSGRSCSPAAASGTCSSSASPTGFNPLPGTVIEGNADGDRVTFQREDGQTVQPAADPGDRRAGVQPAAPGRDPADRLQGVRRVRQRLVRARRSRSSARG